jgi:hypothetical protein
MEATKVLNPITITVNLDSYVRRIDGKLQELIELGSIEKVASHLKGLGIRGVPGCVSHCVIAQYLMMFISELAWIEIESVKSVIKAAVIVHNSTEELSTPLPRELVRFIDEFDFNQHPDLTGAPCNCAAFLEGA